jgi:acyl-CoA reductase-like NAD-dependent aldehyde dehydrogenase
MTSTVGAKQASLLPSVEAFLATPRRLVIGGELRDAVDGATFETLDPATETPLATVAEARAEDIDLAVRAARQAFEGEWAQLTPADRSLLLNRLADAIEEHADEFAQLESLDVGKPLGMARARDINLVIAQFRYFAGWPTKIDGRLLATSIPNTLAYSRREPLGVVGAIVPWNFPLNLACWKVAPALAAGCTVVLKPAEQTPLSALRLGELALEVGLPAGVLNVCPGFGETAGAALSAHPGIDAIAFTGSVPVGREVGRSAVANLTHASLELGGKSPSIVLPDADPAVAAAKTAAGIFFNSGQVCSAPSRMMVHQSLYDDVLGGVVEYAESLQMGSGLDPADAGQLLHRDRRGRGRSAGHRWRSAPATRAEGILRAADRHREQRRRPDGGTRGDLRTGPGRAALRGRG